MRKTIGCLLLIPVLCLFFLIGICSAQEDEISISIDSPESSQNFSPGDDVEISGKAENVRQVSLIVFNPKGSIAYVAQPSVINSTFTTGFQLNSDALEGIYAVKIGAEGLGAPLEFTFGVSKDGTSSPTGGSSTTTAGGASTTTGGGGATTSGEESLPAATIQINQSETPFAPASSGTQHFSDINGHWAIGSINQLVALGAIGGYPDGSFKPDNTISRAEFITVLVKAYKLNQQQDTVFQDTANHWARPHIAAAVASGVANGYNSGNFGPDNPITREQAAMMLIKAAGLQTTAGDTSFVDSASISVWAREAMVTMTQKGLMTGYSDNTIGPQKHATRAEAVTLIMNVLNAR